MRTYRIHHQSRFYRSAQSKVFWYQLHRTIVWRWVNKRRIPLFRQNTLRESWLLSSDQGKFQNDVYAQAPRLFFWTKEMDARSDATKYGIVQKLKTNRRLPNCEDTGATPWHGLLLSHGMVCCWAMAWSAVEGRARIKFCLIIWCTSDSALCNGYY